jgi:predicted dehydrogenase
MTAPRIIVTGIAGFGRVHLENVLRLESQQRVRLVALVDPAVSAPPEAAADVPIYAALEDALERHGADVVIVATPPHTHAALAELSMRAGADVLLEKPPVPSMPEFDRLLALEEQTGRAIQVGFQSLGSAAIPALAADALGIGATQAVSATGLWSRPRSYWTRSRWAGHRTLDGRPVVDGVATNALAHAVATALRIAGYDRPDREGGLSVEVDAYRANPIETDDTTSVRVTAPGLPTVTCALTLCAPAELVERPDHAALVSVHGAERTAHFSYTTDVVTIGAEEHGFGRTALLENLLDHRASGAELLVPVASTRAFEKVLEALRLAPAPAEIPAEHVLWTGEDGARHPVITGIEAVVRDAAQRGLLFRELDVPWARTI